MTGNAFGLLNDGMMSVEKQLATVALGLSPKKRAKLADLLLDSLAGQKEREIASIWAEESAARAKAWQRGEIKSVPLEKAFGFKL